MHRRSFLDFRRLLQPLHEALGQASAPTQEPAPVLLRFSRRAMATDFEILFPFGGAPAHTLADAALNEIDRLEAQLTVYRPESEVSLLNARAAQEKVSVSANLFQLLCQARGLWQTTGGAFDIAMGALIKCWGFFRRQGQTPRAEDLAQARGRSGLEHLELDDAQGTVRFLRPGLEINLGSIGKGYALDQALQVMRRQGFTGSTLLHGGHSSVLAQGQETPARQGWSIGVMHPVQTTLRLGVLHLRDRGLATSAATHQHFVHQGKKLGHLLDPRTGWPAWSQNPALPGPGHPAPDSTNERPVLSATVTAPTATEADALATAFFILGEQGARLFCEQRPTIGAVLVLERSRRPVLLGKAKEEWENTCSRAER